MAGSSAFYSKIRRWDINTVLNLNFENNHGKVWKKNVRVEFDPKPNIHYEVDISLTNDIVNNSYGSVSVKSRFNYYDNIDTSITNQCGIRVKSIKNYTKTGSLASHKSIRYHDGKLLNKFEPISVIKANHKNSAGGVTNGNFFEYIAFYKKLTISTDDFGVNGGNLIGYDKVEEIELDGNLNTIGKKIFTYINIENKTKKGLPNIPNLKNGLISREEIENALGELLYEKKYFYTNLSSFKSYNIVKIKQKSFGLIPCGQYYFSNPYIVSFYESMGSFSGTKYGYDVYPINSEWNKLEKIETNQFFDNDTVTSTESYTYNNLGKIQTITSTNSKNESIIKKVYYANDGILNNSQMAQYMTFSGMLGIPVYEQNYNGTKLLSSQKTLYDKPGVNFNCREDLSQKNNYTSKNTTAFDKRIKSHS